MNQPRQNYKPFIPAWFDDLPLSANQYRVLCHIVRRGDSWASVGTMAEKCRLHPKTIRQSLHELAAMGIILREDRTGKTSIYRLADTASCQSNPSQTDTVVAPVTPPKRIEGTTPKAIQPYPSQTDTAKGIPIEGNPMRGERLPPVLKQEHCSVNLSRFDRISLETQVKRVVKEIQILEKIKEDGYRLNENERARIRDLKKWEKQLISELGWPA